MPLDLRAIQAGRERELSDFIGRIPGQAAEAGVRTRSLLEASRNAGFAAIPDLVGQYGGGGYGQAVAEQSALRKAMLARNAESSIARSGLNAQNEAVQRRYEQVLRLALQSGQSAQDAVATARQAVMDEMQRSQEVASLQKRKEEAYAKSDIADVYAKEGISLEDAYSNKTDYEAAIIRALSGLAGAGLTVVGLNKYYNKGDLDLARQSVMRTPTLSEAWTRSRNLTSPPVPNIDFNRYMGGR